MSEGKACGPLMRLENIKLDLEANPSLWLASKDILKEVLGEIFPELEENFHNLQEYAETQRLLVQELNINARLAAFKAKVTP